MGSNPAILAYLLNQEKGPSVNHAQRKGITPLMLAVKRYHNEHIKPLLAAGANVGAVDHRDVGALHYAAQVGNTAAIRILLKAGADCNARTRDGFTPLTVAAANAHLDAFNELLRYGAETHLDDDAQNRTVYHFAAHGGSAAIIRAIAESVPALKVGAVAGGYTPLMMAAENGHVDAVRALIGVGADPQGTGTRGGTALHVAAQAARVEVMDVLLRAGADVDQATTGGVTPLMLAAGRGRHRAVRYLLDQGANPKLRDNKGRSAADIARMEGHEKLAERLSRLASAD
jgi:ankyrin repeat protein